MAVTAYSNKQLYTTYEKADQNEVCQKRQHGAECDFTGIGNATNFLASLVHWHACGIVNGLVLNEQGLAGVQNWGLTRLGELFQQSNPTIIAPGSILSLMRPRRSSPGKSRKPN